MDNSQNRFKVLNSVQNNSHTERKYKRKIAAIMSADVKGYSKLMGSNEELTVTTITEYRQVFYKKVREHSGRVIDSPGDNILSEFSSALDAVKCAREIQAEIKERNKKLDNKRKMQFRIGINLGDVIEDQGRLYGDGVNIAARLESLAKPDGICFSGTVYDQVKGKTSLKVAYLGKQSVKNINHTVRTYKLLLSKKEAIFKREYKVVAYCIGLIVSLFLFYQFHTRYLLADHLIMQFLSLNPLLFVKSYLLLAIPPFLLVIGFIIYAVIRKGIDSRALKLFRALCYGGVITILIQFFWFQIPAESQFGLQDSIFASHHLFAEVIEQPTQVFQKHSKNSQSITELNSGDMVMLSDTRKTVLTEWNNVFVEDDKTGWIHKLTSNGSLAISAKIYSFKFSDLTAILVGVVFAIIGLRKEAL